MVGMGLNPLQIDEAHISKYYRFSIIFQTYMDTIPMMIA